MSNSGSHLALQKENIVTCIICAKYIPEDLQTSIRKICHKPSCKRTHVRNLGQANRAKVRALKRHSVTNSSVNPTITRTKMRKEIDSLYSRQNELKCVCGHKYIEHKVGICNSCTCKTFDITSSGYIGKEQDSLYSNDSDPSSDYKE